MTGVFYTIFGDADIYCNRWQLSVDFYENRIETAQKEKQYTEQYTNIE